MNLDQLLKFLHENGVELSVEDGDLILLTGEEVLDDSDVLDDLRRHKPELIEAVASGRYGRVSEQGPATPPLLIPGDATQITPDMLNLVSLDQDEIDRITQQIAGGAANIQDIYPLAPLQEGILFHHLMAQEGDPYLQYSLMRFPSREALDAYVSALQIVIDRHDILRTAILWEGLSTPVQVVVRRAPLLLEERQLDQAQGPLELQLRAAFHPRHYRLDVRQAPLKKCVIAADPIGGGWLMLDLFHHLIDDHSTLEVQQDEIRTILQGRAATLGPALPFRHFIAQARLGVTAEQHKEFFSELLGDLDETTAPFGLSDVQGDGRRIVEAHLTLDAKLALRLRQAARSAGVSAASICHLAYALILARASARKDIVFGTVMFGRMQGVEGIGRAMGLFINTLPFRVRLNQGSVLEALQAVHQLMTALLHHENAPLALAQRCSQVHAPAPLFTAILNYRHAAAPDQVEAKLDESTSKIPTIEYLEVEERTNYPFTLSINDMGEGFSLNAQVDASLDPVLICESVRTALEVLTHALERDPATSIETIDIMSPRERDQILNGWNGSLAPELDKALVHEIFEATAAQYPDSVALRHGTSSLSYDALNTKANRLARFLVQKGVGRGSFVALSTERSFDSIVGLLAILKAGGVYLPIDPHYPSERIQFLLDDAQATLILTQSARSARLVGGDRPLYCLDSDASLWQDFSGENLKLPLEANELAYTIYTSGSTGKPKGVLVEHRHLALTLASARAEFGFGPGDSIPNLASHAFDISLIELLLPLTSGGFCQLVDADAVKDVRALVAVSGACTFFHAVPSLMELWLETLGSQAAVSYPSLRCLLVGGEAVSAKLLGKMKQAFPSATIIELYGPTEATIIASFYRVGSEALETCIGQPFAGNRAYVMGEQGLQGIGVPGELYLGGPTIARGYFQRPDLTADRFIADPYSKVPGARLYKTGDVVRTLANGQLQYLGRSDDQVKIRGFRIELGEIESLLSAHPAVASALVLAREDRPGDKQLVAYLILSQPAAEDPLLPAAIEEQLVQSLRSQLPPYMLPSFFIALPAWPLNVHGKIDRKALPAPDAALVAVKSYTAPIGPVEESLAKIWAEVLHLPRIGRDDNFFERGGHSLLAVSLIERMRLAGLFTDVRTLFSAPTLAALAALLETENRSFKIPPNLIPDDATLITPDLLPLVSLSQDEIDRIAQEVPGGHANIQDIYPLAPLQEGILFHHLMAPQGDPYLMIGLIRFPTRAHMDRYLQATQAVINRHDILRTAILWEGLPAPVQVVLRRAQLLAEEVRLSPDNGPIVDQIKERFHPSHFRIDVRRAPLQRCFVAHDQVSNEWILVDLLHHLAGDHTTLEVQHHEIEAFLTGQAHTLQKPIPFRNFVAQARFGVSQDEHQKFFSELLGDVSETTPSYGLVEALGDGTDVREAWRKVDRDLAIRLRIEARKLGVSAASLCHLAWALVLGRVADRDDLVFGTVLFGRMQGGEGSDRVMGLFINTLPLRYQIGTDSVRDSALRMHRLLTDLLHHEHAPLSLAQRASQVEAPAPLFTALLNYRYNSVLDADSLVAGQIKAPEDAHPALKGIEYLGAEERTNYPLDVSIDDLGQDFVLNAQVHASIDPDRVCATLHAAMKSLIEALERTPQRALKELDVIPETERVELIQLRNENARKFPEELTLSQLIEAQVARTPSATALIAEEVLSYEELNARANRLARFLKAKGAKPDQLIGLCHSRKSDLIVGILAILKAGAAYVPIDPLYPRERIATMIEDAELSLLLTEESLLASLPQTSQLQTICLDRDQNLWKNLSTANVTSEAKPGNLVYTIYTSGSTGKPKGVMLEHRALVSYITSIIERYAFGPDDRILQFASISFDVAGEEIFAALASGATLTLRREDDSLQPQAFIAQLSEAGITKVELPTAYWQQLTAEMIKAKLSLPPTLRLLLIGGEAVQTESVEAWFRYLGQDGPELLNTYGPTETTIVASIYAFPRTEKQAPGAAPIGTPVANTQMYILDAQGRLAPTGVAGELYIGGVHLARGYWKRPDLTAERFLPDPFSATPGARIYKTGDLARWLPTGQIQYLGRSDFQVKIRGFRIELGEIETQILRQGAVRDVLVLAREDQPGDRRLVAYLSPQAGAKASETLIENVREHLTANLPSYMVPSAFVVLESFPLTRSGKIDRKALPAPGVDALKQSAYVPPEGSLELATAAIWAEVLKLERIGRFDNFFELGGHSLLAITLIDRMRSAGLHTDVRRLFASPTLAALVSQLSVEARTIAVPPLLIPSDAKRISPEQLNLISLSQKEIDLIASRVPGGAANIQDIYPLAPLQEGILFHHLAAEKGDPYLLFGQLRFATRELLDRYLMAMQTVIDRHDILRTAVQWEGLPQAVQVVWRKAELEVEEIKFDAANGDVATQLRKRFNPRTTRMDVRRAPLQKSYITFDAAQGNWILMDLLHHLAGDHTTVEVQFNEIRTILKGETETLQVPLPFRSFVAQAILGVSPDDHKRFFTDMLGDLSEPTTPFGLTEAQGDGRSVREAWLSVDTALSRRLRSEARKLGISAASVWHLAWGLLLSQLSGRDDVVFGTVLFGRMQGGEGSDRVMGLFINTLPLRLRLALDSVRTSVLKTHRLLSDLLYHEHAPLALAQRCSQVAAPAPLFTGLLNYRYSSSPDTVLLDASDPFGNGIDYITSEERTNYPLDVSIDDLGQDFAINAQVHASIDPDLICAYLQQAMQQLVSALESNPDQPTLALNILPTSEQQKLQIEWNATARPFPEQLTLSQLIEAQVARTPNATALIAEEVLSYEELNARANRLARFLQAKGAKPDQLIGLCHSRKSDLIVGILAILKAGAAYVPIDPLYPRERIATMIEDAELSLLLTEESLLASLPQTSQLQAICLDRDQNLWKNLSSANVMSEAEPGNLVYTIYTSGSTGKPKGVMLEHRALVSYITSIIERYAFGPDDRILQFASISFDVAGEEIFAALASGATLTLRREDDSLQPQAFIAQLSEAGITKVELPTAYWQQLTAEMIKAKLSLPPTLRLLLIGGEAVQTESVEAWFRYLGQDGPELLNTYGPTETTIVASIYAFPRTDKQAPGAAPIGTPVANTQMYILDAQGRLAPTGVAGELYIGGVHLARGYWKRPDLTAERFLPDPFSATPGARIYKTGDLARWLPTGQIQYLGRSDFQVKIRGFRIELGEIETQLLSHPAVKEALVLAREDHSGDRRLVAYLCRHASASASEALLTQLREHLAATLPSYMVPAAFVLLDAMPVTRSGKIDRKALPAPEANAYVLHQYEAPLTPVEISLAHLWAEVLRRERVGRQDNFFELGGHSLLAVTLIEKMRQAGMHTDVRALFTAPTLAELATRVRSESRLVEVAPLLIPHDAKAITPEMLTLVSLSQDEIDRIAAAVPGGVANIQDIYPLAPLQEGILFHHQMATEGDPYLLFRQIRFATRAQIDRHISAVQAVIDRHDILRTAILWEGFAAPLQVVLRHAPLLSEEIKFDPQEGPIAKQLRDRFDPSRMRIDVQTAPLQRCYLAEDPIDGGWVLMELLHHLIGDHTTLEIQQQEVEAILLGQAHTLAQPLPFRNFVAQARLGVSAEEHQAFFSDMLGAIDEPTAPFGLLDVQGDGQNLKEAWLDVAPDVAQRMRTAARSLGVSAASLCHLAWAQVLARLTGRESVVFGTLMFGRMQGGEGSDRVMGIFINTLPICLQVGPESVRSSVLKTHHRLTQLLHHEHAPLALAQRSSAVKAPAPLFTTLLNYRHSTPPPELPEDEKPQLWEGIEYIASEERTNYPFTLSVDDLGAGFALNAQVSASQDPDRICAFMHRALELLVESLEKTPELPLAALDILPVPERAALMHLGLAAQLPRSGAFCLHQLFEQQVERAPLATAVICDEISLSYDELNRRANRLAHYLREEGVGPDRLVGLCVERSVEMIVGILAILKAGGAYVPIDPAYPADRMSHMIENSAMSLLLTQARLLDRLPKSAFKALCFDRDAALWNERPSANPSLIASPENLVYVIFTSGSTGQAKGVMLEHRALTSFIPAMIAHYGMRPQDRALQFVSISFDVAVEEIFSSLLAGATLIVRSETLSLVPSDFLATIAAWGITRMDLPTAYWHEFTTQLAAQDAQLPPSLRLVVIGGEAAQLSSYRTWYQQWPNGPRLVNGYGPTETTITATIYEGDAADSDSVPIGRPVPNSEAYILDTKGLLCPHGVFGELHIGGAHLARGYLKDPALSAAKFVPHPFAEQSGARLYKTGDLVRWRPDGQLEYQGRSDSQVKIRGFRVELGEIETRLMTHAAVREALVLARDDVSGAKKLIAYVVKRSAQSCQPEELEAHLRSSLPAHMVPSAYVVLDAFPLSVNGKIDRQALARYEIAADSQPFVPPETPSEKALAPHLSAILGLERIGRDENFFALGLHSLLATQLVARLRRALKVDVPLRLIFEAASLRQLAKALDERRLMPEDAGSKEDALRQQISSMSEAEILALLEKKKRAALAKKGKPS